MRGEKGERERLTVVTDREAERCVCFPPTTLSLIHRLHYFLSPPSPPPSPFILSPLPSSSSLSASLPCCGTALGRLPSPLTFSTSPHSATARAEFPHQEEKKKESEGGKPGGGTATRRACHSLEVHIRCFSSPLFNPLALVPEIFLAPWGKCSCIDRWSL